MLTRLLAVSAVALVLVGLLAYSQQRTKPLTVSGFVEAHEIRVGSRVGGRVKAVKVEEGQTVKPGMPLLELEPFDLQEQAAQARALLAERTAARDKLRAGYRSQEIAQAEERWKQLSANLKKLQKGPREQEIEAAAANLEQAQSQLTLATERHRRSEGLLAKGALTQEQMDEVLSELKVARATFRAREEDLGLLKAGTRPEDIEQAESQLKEAEFGWKLLEAGYRLEDIDAADAAVSAAAAAVAALEQQIAELVVQSPVAGTVEAVELRPGDLVGSNTPTISLMDTSELWVRAYLPENHLDVQVGQKVAVSVDSFPGRRFDAHISYVARQAEFTPGNVQTPEERSKQVFRIKVTLDSGLQELRPGMAADVWLEEPPGKP